MAMAIATTPGPLAVSLAEAKALLRLDGDSEDALIASQIRTAMGLCEAFTGQWLIVREGRQPLAADMVWQRISVAPVQAVLGVTTPAGGFADWEADISADGTGWVRCRVPPPPGAQVQFSAGLGADWNAVPEPLRAGIIRLVSHFYTHRDAADAGPPPAAVAALWRPWRRLRLA